MASSSNMESTTSTFYPYTPSKALAAVFAVLVGVSLSIHIWQNFRYKYWRVMFFMCWGGLVFTSGWVMRSVSSFYPENRNFYISESILILCGPPIYSAAEYNILGRLMHYLPMHAPLNPSRLIYFFIYLGALVEGLTAAGAARLSTAGDDQKLQRSGGTLVAVGSVLQAAVECIFIGMIAHLHNRCVRSNMLTSNVRTVFIMLYGTSGLVLFRSIFRAVEKFSTLNVISTGQCDGVCDAVLRHEWYLYAFEAAPMVLYTYWLNIVHPGKYLPNKTTVYLGFDKEEYEGPGWTDKRSKWETFADPFDLKGAINGQKEHEKFWLLSQDGTHPKYHNELQA
ncbi:hypothetical protein A7C99_6728 [Trichophyton rubrum]|uniref:RTA1 domain-containing protein n=5 Tax=Trichophyton TaxID=5550 RepID=A0A178ERT4_TRIRU|nr:RTA-like protein [Trichophyton rubrum]OAL62153.1 hypothetical protein A7C99_6728 [Trichophyton rubrum]